MYEVKVSLRLAFLITQWQGCGVEWPASVLAS